MARASVEVPEGLVDALAPLVLTGSRDLLHDMLYGALIDAGERLATLSSRGWRGDVRPELIQEAAGEVLSLHALLGRLESEPPCR